MPYRSFVLSVLLTLVPMVCGAAGIQAQPFPGTINDLTTEQRRDLNSVGYEPFYEAVTYNGISVVEPEIPYDLLKRMAELNNDGDNTSDPSQDNQEDGGKQNDSGHSDNDNVAPPPVMKQPKKMQPAPPTNIGRKVCFAKDTQGVKRFVPPRVTNQRAYWWIGDSRFVGMYINGVIGKKDTEAVAAYGARGLRWFTTEPAPTGMSLLLSCLRDGDVVILGLGTNDINSYNSYISTYRKLMSDYPNVTFKVLSVNPVCNAKTKYLKNSQVETFNAKLKSAFPNDFIDTYSILKSRVNASNTDAEGLHYRGGGIEQTVYDTVMASVGK